uniref:Uncharacterized protein n=1 Tax=viral metagenome TaxID=1070528 RepID=A0A6C0AFH8_9ZZZZ
MKITIRTFWISLIITKIFLKYNLRDNFYFHLSSLKKLKNENYNKNILEFTYLHLKKYFCVCF